MPSHHFNHNACPILKCADNDKSTHQAARQGVETHDQYDPEPPTVARHIIITTLTIHVVNTMARSYNQPDNTRVWKL